MFFLLSFLLDLFLLAFFVVGAFTGSVWLHRFSTLFGTAFRQCSRHFTPTLIVLSLAVVSLLAALAFFHHWPKPGVHDEFVYLLIADTFAHGRLTNPTHPMWESLQSFYVLQHPTYQGKYPPASSLFMAVGQIAFNQPIVGVWLATGLAIFSVGWMLRGYVPSRWALFGTVVIATNTGVVLTWGQSYWGGAVPMLGGALVFGALPRIVRRLHARDAVLLAVGIGLLANSRPYEGFLMLLPVALYLAIWFIFDKASHFSERIFKFCVPVFIVVSANFTSMALYNKAVTGNAFVLPYMEWANQKNLSITDVLFSGPLRKTFGMVIPRQRAAAKTSRIDLPRRNLPTLRIQVPPRWKKLLIWEMFYLKTALLPAILVLPFFVRTSSLVRTASMAVSLVLVGVIMSPASGHPHYFSPAIAPLLIVLTQGFRFLQTAWRRTSTSPPDIAFGIPCITTVVFCFAIIWQTAISKNHQESWHSQRFELQNALSELDDRHLVLVHYQDTHNAHCEWVYNGADIDGSQVVWARESNPEQNRRLLDYFSDRKLWLLEADYIPPRLTFLERNENGSFKPGPSTFPDELGKYAVVGKSKDDVARSSISAPHNRK